jgi:hypothetical protein
VRIVNSAHFEDILLVSLVVDTHGSIVLDVGELNADAHIDFIDVYLNERGVLPINRMESDSGQFSHTVGPVCSLTGCLGG